MREPPQGIEVVIQPPDNPDPKGTARRLRGLRELAEQIRARLEREARERGKRDDSAA
jgi:hypothetical protein